MLFPGLPGTAQPVVTLLVCVLLTAMLPTAEMGVRKWFM